MKYGMALSAPLTNIYEQILINKFNAVQVFSLDRKLYTDEQVQEYQTFMESHGVTTVIHSPLMTNLVSEKERTRLFSISTLMLEMVRSYFMGSTTMVVHPGSNSDTPVERLAASLTELYTRQEAKGRPHIAKLCIETMCGAGNQFMTTPEEFKKLFDLTGNPYIYCCLDTAHIYGAGLTPLQFVQGMKSLGILDRLKVVHFNNTLSPFASRKERHAVLEEGQIKWQQYEEFLQFLEEELSERDYEDLILVEEQPSGTNLMEEAKVLKSLILPE